MGFDGSLRQRTPHGVGYMSHGVPPPIMPQMAAVRAPQVPPPAVVPPVVNIPPHVSHCQPQQPVSVPSEPVNDFPINDHVNEMETEEEKPKPELTLCERMNILREKGVGFDVEFTIGKHPSIQYIRAHGCVLAAGSKVFENMLCGFQQNSPPPKKRREANGAHRELSVIELGDVNADALNSVIDYLYSDFKPESINIPNHCVLDTLHIARQYEIPQLEKHCVKLLGDISPPLAVALLEQARRFGSEELTNRCFEIIDEQTDEALSADCFPNLDKKTVKMIIDRSELTPSDEVTVFRAACEWAEAECARQKLPPKPENKRRVLGEIFNALRFPTMSLEEFGEAANSGLFNDEEVGKIFRYISSTVRPSFTLPFVTTERRCLGRSKYVVKRFITLSKNPCKKQRSSIWFIVSREIMVTALGVYGLIQNAESTNGSGEWETNVEIEVGFSGKSYEVKDHAALTLRGAYGDVRPLIARFKKPIRIVPNIPHRASVFFTEEVETYAGGNGAEDVRVHIGSGESVQECGIGKTPPTPDSTTVVHFAFHNDDPNGVRRGMTRGPAVFTGAVGGFYNRPAQRSQPVVSEGCLYEGQIPEIHFLAPNFFKKEPIQ